METSRSFLVILSERGSVAVECFLLFIEKSFFIIYNFFVAGKV